MLLMDIIHQSKDPWTPQVGVCMSANPTCWHITIRGLCSSRGFDHSSCEWEHHMRRRHRANINVEGLESKVALSGIAPTIVIHPHPSVTDVTHFDGSLQGFYFQSSSTPVAPTPPTSPTPPAISVGTSVAPTAPTIQLHGGGMVSPLGEVRAEGTITASGGQLTLRRPHKNATETVILTVPTGAIPALDGIETFSYKTTDGKYEGTLTIDLHSPPSAASTPSQFGTFTAEWT